MEPSINTVEPESIPKGARTRQRAVSLATLVWLFYTLAFLFTSSGRLNNWDPLAQLQAATALVTTGSLGVPAHPMPDVPDLWIRNQSGTYYEAHDLGGTLFLIPAAIVGVALEGKGRSAEFLIQQPPWTGRVFGTLEYALLGAVGCYAAFQLCACLYPQRTAFLLSLTFAATTTYWAYTRIAYDILGGCVGVCLLLWFCIRALMRPTGEISDTVKIGAAAALACIFRFSLAPFLILGLLGIIFLLRHRWDWRLRVTALAALLIGLAPNFYFNYLRTEMVVKNGATGSAPATAALQGSLRDGLYGLVLSPNWGLLWFAPILALLILLPLVWRKAPTSVRQSLACFLLPSVMYIIVIAKLNIWTGHSGWGPRYLLPIVPILFLGIVPVLTIGWDRFRRPLLALVVFSALVNLPSLFVNFRAVRTAYPGGSEITAREPRQHIAAWKALGGGLLGVATPVGPDALQDPVRRRAGDFPDIWTARLIDMGPPKSIFGWAAGVLLLTGAAACLREILIRLNKSENLPPE